MEVDTIENKSPANLDRRAISAFIDGEGEFHSSNIETRGLKKRHTFLLFVLIPAFLIAIYFGLLASNQYQVEARMVVRTIGVSEQQASTEEREGRAIIGGDSLTQDSHIVASYLTSKSIVERLETTIGLSTRFQKSEIDFLSRLNSQPTIDEIYDYWLGKIQVAVDGPSGIVVFRVKAFTPEDSLEISNTALRFASEVIDETSQRAKRDLVKRAELELNNSIAAYNVALTELEAFQNSIGILDPELNASIASGTISELLRLKIQNDVQLGVLESLGADKGPSATLMRERRENLDKQIEEAEKKLASDETETSVADRFVDFTRYETQRLASEAIFRANQRNLDIAKSTALSRTTFLSIFAPGVLPIESTHPKRFSTWLLLSFAFLCGWLSVTLVWMSVEDHRS